MTDKATTTVTSPLPAAMRKPYSIDICENSVKAFQMAAALIRQGYVPLQDRLVEVYPHGVAVMTLVLGEPTETGYADAEDAKRQALALEAAEFERRVTQEVESRIEQMKRDEAEAKRTALLQEHKRKLAELEKASAAEIAQLSKQ